MDTYKTIADVSQGIYKEKGSKFLSFAYPISSPQEVPALVEALKKEHFNARHHCYAWRIGALEQITRAVDDGEPSSTAGKPILGQILSFELTNILIVVVRYFGGTKLGVSGLIQAYREAACDAIKEAEVVTRTVDDYFIISFDYLKMNDVMKVVKEVEPDVRGQYFDNSCSLEVSIRQRDSQLLSDRVGKIDGVQIRYIKSE